jgi:hypothetical protein
VLEIKERIKKTVKIATTSTKGKGKNRGCKKGCSRSECMSQPPTPATAIIIRRIVNRKRGGFMNTASIGHLETLADTSPVPRYRYLFLQIAELNNFLTGFVQTLRRFIERVGPEVVKDRSRKVIEVVTEPNFSLLPLAPTEYTATVQPSNEPDKLEQRW